MVQPNNSKPILLSNLLLKNKRLTDKHTLMFVQPVK